MPNGFRIEHLGDIIPKAQNWLVPNLPVSMFVCIHFNVPPPPPPPDQNSRFDQKCIISRDLLEQSVTFVYVFAFINLVCVQSVIQLYNEYSIYHFCIMIKDFSISFSRVISVQDFETVTFYVLFVYKPTLCVIFC